VFAGTDLSPCFTRVQNIPVFFHLAKKPSIGSRIYDKSPYLE
jgi:hypothetical protein